MTHKCFILGTFSDVAAPRFPFVLREFHVYIAMTNGHGSGRGKLQLVSTSKGQPLFQAQGDIRFPSPLAVVEMDFCVANLPIPEPGEYELRFLYNEAQIGLRKIVVHSVSSIPGEATV
jgi:hypothetical protein